MKIDDREFYFGTGLCCGAILLFLALLVFSQSAFAAMPQDVIINSITVNSLTIDLVCKDPKVTGSTAITGYRLDIDDSALFDSINISDSAPQICDEVTLNSINISPLAENTLYNLRLTVSTNNAGDSIDTDVFTTLGTTEVTLTESMTISDLVIDNIVSHFEVTLIDSLSIIDQVTNNTTSVFEIILIESISITDEIIITQIQEFEIVLTETLSISGVLIIGHMASIQDTLTNSMSMSDAIIVLVNSQQQSNGGGDSDHKWRTMPTFGMDHTILGKQMVENGLVVNERQITITDNFHMTYPIQELETGLLHTLTAKSFSPRGLKMVEFMFGIPEVGKHYEAEATVEIWLDRTNPSIIINQKDNLIKDDVIALKRDARCNQKDPTMCESVTVFLTFNESPLTTVFAIQAIDLASRNIITTLNHGIDVTGESLNPPKTDYMAQGKNGLVLMTQQDKKNELWIDPNEIL